MSAYSEKKTAICWVGGVAATLSFMVPLTFMVNHYNETERDRSIACTKEYGIYKDGSCAWTRDVSR